MSNVDRVVFDCNIYLQFLISPNGAGARCVEIALRREVELLVSDAVLREIQELSEKDVGRKNHLSDARISHFIEVLLRKATFIDSVPVIYEHPIDPDDSAYINLALSAKAKLIVSRDRHLLGLNDRTKPWASDFRLRFPDFRVVDAVQFLRQFDDRPLT